MYKHICIPIDIHIYIYMYTYSYVFIYTNIHTGKPGITSRELEQRLANLSHAVVFSGALDLRVLGTSFIMTLYSM